MEDARSLKGRMGVDAEVKLDGRPRNRAFGSLVGSLEVENEFLNDNKVVASGAELKSEAEATWLRLGLNGVHIDGRYTVQGRASYATSGGSREFGSGVSLSLRF